MATTLALASASILRRSIGASSSPSTSTLLSHLRNGGGRLSCRRPQRWLSSYPPHEVVGLPSLSPTMESGVIASWNKEVGDEFGPGDVLCSVETDKATVDFEAQDDGVLAKILVAGGDGTEIPCGTPIAITVENPDDVAAFKDYQSPDQAAPEPAAAAPAAVEPPAAAPTPAPEPAAAAEAPAPAASSPPPAAATGGRVVASPLAHMIAKDMGFDISSISGTGPGGRIIAADVKEFQPSAADSVSATAGDESTTAAPASSAAPPVGEPMVGSGFTDYPLSADAKELAARLAQSKRNVPHYYLTVDIAMDRLLELRAKLADDGTGIGTYEFLLKAAAASMKAVPAANASWRGDVVRVYENVDVNVVVGSGDALYTPVLKDVGRRGLQSLSDDLNGFMESVDGDEEVPSSFAAMGTFTVMNLGAYGIKSCAPIIREPQACALALGAIENRIVPNDDNDDSSDEIYKQSAMMTVTLSCDHRVVDGAVGAQWLSAFKQHVEHPTTLLL